MNDILGFISKIFSVIGSLLLLIWKIVKLIISKLWKFILAIVGTIASIFIAKKAINKED